MIPENSQLEVMILALILNGLPTMYHIYLYFLYHHVKPMWPGLQQIPTVAVDKLEPGITKSIAIIIAICLLVYSPITRLYSLVCIP